VTPSAFAFLGLTAVVAVLVGTLTFAVLRILSAARETRRRLRGEGSETSVLSVALQDAVGKLKAQERAMARRAEASERLSGDIIANLTAGLLMVNGRGEVQLINPVGCRLLGLEEGLHRGADYRELLAHVAPVAALIGDCLAAPRPITRRTIQVESKAGGLSHFGLTVSPLSGPSSETQGAICLFTDLTTVVALEEQVRLKESLARVGELTAGIAHEFRNGLATIHGYSRLLELDALPPAFRPYVEGIRAETESMRQVVTNFLNFARPTQILLSPVDLAAVAERAADDLRAEARELGGDITVGGVFATIEGDDVLLRQALSNLLRNAVEACAREGLAPSIRVCSSIDAAHGVCVVSVADNGPGFPAAVRERVFHPFFTTKSQGTGLGLALVQKIIVTHNGRVTVENAPEGGGRVVVSIPLTAGS
jgi:signal transduction histidine kinase